MFLRIGKLQYASLPLALFLAGCESRPPAGPLPVRVAQAGTAAPQAPPASAGAAPLTFPPTPTPTGSGSSAPPPASGGFSLPIGVDFPATSAPAPNSPGKPTLQVGPLADQPDNRVKPPPGQAAQQGQQAPPPARSGQAASSPAPAQGPIIHLSAGIAVPQSLPTGTVMALSVDYSLRAELKGSSRYVWVVKSGGGEVVTEVQLESSGNLSAFFQQLRPEHRPFSVRIEEVTPGSKRRTIISNEVTLKTDY